MKRTGDEVCVEYAIAADSVREQTRIMANNRCKLAVPFESDTGYFADTCMNLPLADRDRI